MLNALRFSLLAGTLLTAAITPNGATAAEPLKAYLQPAVHVLHHDARTNVQSPENGELNGMSDDVIQSLSCTVTGASATALALAVGGENLVNVIAGGVVAPANRVVLYIGLVGVVFASFCQIGQALTPLVLYLTVPGGPSVQDQPVHHRKADANGPVQGGVRLAHSAGVLASVAKAPPLRTAMPARTAPQSRSLAKAHGLPELVKVIR